MQVSFSANITYKCRTHAEMFSQTLAHGQEYNSLVLCLGLLACPYFYRTALESHCALVVALSEKIKYHSSGAIGNAELIQKCFPKHSSMRTARMK